jgi:CO/xanthine dehydrogenase Mo-binding subunit
VIANAVAAATGARVTELPLTPERVRNAMTQQPDGRVDGYR